MTVDILCAVLNGARFLPDFFRGLDAQTHADWRLWVRDDGSTDGTIELLHARARADERTHVLHVGGPPSGATRAFAWLLDRVPADARYVMMADADDVWQPDKIALTLDALVAAEARESAATPILVHTDMIVVDERLETLHPSFWGYAAIDPEPATLRRVAVRNVVTGPTVLVNRALADELRGMPSEAVYHDGWAAMVAAALGRIIALPQRTVLYRQHGSNAVGAASSKAVESWRDTARAIGRGIEARVAFRRAIARTAAQARAFVDRYGTRLSNDDRAFLEAYARIPERSFIRRKLDMMRLDALPERGWLKNVGRIVRG